jgi:outer membrane biosynthesis protein TonB
MGGDAIWVDVVTLDPGASSSPSEVSQPDDPVEDLTQIEETNPVEDVAPDTASVQTDTPPDTASVEPQENPQENPAETTQPEDVQPDNPQSQYVSVGASGEAGAGAPGPATYEGRVFSAIRRNFRTSVQPPQSYRIEFTVNTDGSTDLETIRTSGDAAFDRAVEHALAVAQIPPFPPGRTSPAVLRIEFLGTDQQ